MKQKIVMKVDLTSEKSKTKALKVVAEAHGVESVAVLEGSEKTLVVVIGVNVDTPRLISSLRNKVAHAELMSISEVKPATNSSGETSTNQK